MEEIVQKKKMSKKLKYFIIGLSIISILSVSSIYAFLGDNEQKKESVMVGDDVLVELYEPSYNESSGQSLSAGATIAKDPYAENKGKVDAWVFMKIEVPKKNLTVSGASSPSMVDLYSFTTNTGWTEISRTSGTNSTTYIYGYNSILKAGQRTSTPLYNQVKVVNFIDITEFDTNLNGNLEDDERLFTISVNVMSIQSSADTTMKNAYTKYANQNK